MSCHPIVFVANDHTYVWPTLYSKALGVGWSATIALNCIPYDESMKKNADAFDIEMIDPIYWAGDDLQPGLVRSDRLNQFGWNLPKPARRLA